MGSAWKLRFSDFARVGCDKFRNYMCIYSRRSVITSSWIGKKVRIYNGKSLKPMSIRPFHFKHYFWEFNITKRMGSFHTLSKHRAVKKKKA